MANPQTHYDDPPINAEDDAEIVLTDDDRRQLTPADIEALSAVVDAEVIDEQPAPAPAPVIDQQPAPAPAPATDYSADIAAQDAAMRALRASWDDGDVSVDDYNRQQDELQAARDELITARALQEANPAPAQPEDNGGDRQEDPAFALDAQRYATAYPELFSDAHFTAFNALFEQNDARASSANLTTTQLLEKTHREYAALAEAQHRPLQVSLPGTGGVGGRKDEVPPSIADVPASGLDAHQDRFSTLAAQIDTMDNPDDIEAILAKLPPDQRDAFASFGDDG
jgi:hypothetical protein